jgi:copper ion binding protein
MIRKILNVEGMSCAHCKMAVTKAVSSLEGVGSVEVSLENNTATVEFEESKLSLETIKQAIQAQGYAVV